jgi:phospholipase/carboxylesterase
MFGARAWWMLDLERAEQAMADGPRSYADEIPPGMEEATDQVVQMIRAMQDELGVSNERLIVGGFSQGSMAACNAVFTRELSPAGLLVLSGTPVNLAAWKAGMASRSGLPVFQSHGEQDALLSFQAAEDLNKDMRDAGLATQWVPFRGGHELPVQVLEGLSRFLSAIEPPI